MWSLITAFVDTGQVRYLFVENQGSPNLYFYTDSGIFFAKTHTCNQRREILHTKTWRTIHRLTGLFTLVFLLFYAFSGVLLNHRKYFNHFMDVTTETKKVAFDPDLLRDFREQCQAITGRDEEPETIFIKDKDTIEIRYARHDAKLYRILPTRSTLETDTRVYQQPWHGMKWLHVAYQTSPMWVWATDVVGICMIIMGLSALFCFRYRRLDYIAIGMSAGLFCLLVLIG